MILILLFGIIFVALSVHNDEQTGVSDSFVKRIAVRVVLNAWTGLLSK